MDILKVVITKQADKDLRKAPDYIVLKLQAWVDEVTEQGLREVRKVPGFHDEPLKGKRKGQRSIRLSKAYRAIYTVDEANTIQFISIIEMNKHDY